MKKPFGLLILGILLINTSCEEEPGPGGRASITGKVLVQDFNGNCTILNEEYYAPDEEVHIIYGDDPSYSERIRTGPGGVYWFPYLKTGRYTVYAISENCSAPGGLEIVQQEVEIDEKRQQVTLSDIIVMR